jgi:hypothetical protein
VSARAQHACGAGRAWPLNWERVFTNSVGYVIAVGGRVYEAAAPLWARDARLDSAGGRAREEGMERLFSFGHGGRRLEVGR